MYPEYQSDLELFELNEGASVNDWKGPFFAFSNLFTLDTGGGLIDWALIPRLVQHGRFAFSFLAKEGKVYEVQDSFNLLNWETVRTYNGKGVSIRFDEERDHDPPKWFYRVKVVE